MGLAQTQQRVLEMEVPDEKCRWVKWGVKSELLDEGPVPPGTAAVPVGIAVIEVDVPS
jgi:hypothetical protein